MSNQQKHNPTPSGVKIKTNTRTVNITNVYVNKAPTQKKHYPTEQKNKTAPVGNHQPQKPHAVVKQPMTVNNFYNVTMGGSSKTKIQQNNINVPRKAGPHEAKPQMQHGPKTFQKNDGNTWKAKAPQQQSFTKPQHPSPQQHAQNAKPKMHNPNKTGQGKQVTITNVYNVTLAPSDQKHLAMALKLGNLSLSKP